MLLDTLVMIIILAIGMIFDEWSCARMHTQTSVTASDS